MRSSGQLFDWFVYGNKAIALTERLPSLITGSPVPAGIDTIYTQIIDEIELTPGPHTFGIRYTRRIPYEEVEFVVDGKVVVKAVCLSGAGRVDALGVPQLTLVKPTATSGRSSACRMTSPYGYPSDGEPPPGAQAVCSA